MIYNVFERGCSRRPTGSKTQCLINRLAVPTQEVVDCSEDAKGDVNTVEVLVRGVEKRILEVLQLQVGQFETTPFPVG